MPSFHFRWAWAGLRGSGEAALGLVVAVKALLFTRHALAVRFSAGELLALALLQPALDLAFTAGILEGFWQLAPGRARPID